MPVCNPRRIICSVLLLILATALPAIAQTVAVSPQTATVVVDGTRQLKAYINSLPTTAIDWSVNGVAGGNASVGWISSSGVYTAPAIPPAGFTVTATATSKANATRSASCIITVRHRVPIITAVGPSPLTGATTVVSVTGDRFVAGARVLWNGTALATTVQSSSQLSATIATPRTGTVYVTVSNPGPGAVSSPFYVSVRPAPTATRPPSTPTFTRPPATATRTPTALRTFTPTRTMPPPTATFTRIPPTATAVPPTATFTRVPPTATFTRTMPMATATMPMATATMRMEPTATMTMMGEPTRTPTTRTSSPTVRATGTPTAGTNPSPTTIPTNPPLDPQAVTYGRFLEQASFGPTQQTTARLAQIGIPAYLEEQFALPESAWPPLSTTNRGDVIDAFFGNALAGQDQLRQRMIYALSEIIVEASNKNTNANEIIPWLQLLSRNAFGNYRTLLEDITLDGGMGKYLDLANSGLMGGAANENYPREVMQLFSIGLYRLNLDGSVQVNAQGAPIPTYTQADVQQLAKALTGWTWGNASNTPPTYQNSNYYPGPMLPVANRHDTSQKTVLGEVIPAGQTAQQDLQDAIDIIFYHPNVGPFLCTRLLRALVTSNPTPGYIARCATAFNNSSGERGDMKSVLRAILLDTEARNDTPPATFGRLRTPVQHTIALVRALNLNPGPASQFAYLFTYMNESMLDAPSVFGHYSPSYRIPRTALFGPEFQIYSLSDAINRANFLYSLMYQYPTNPLLQPYLALAGNGPALVDAVDRALMFGRMAPATRTALLNALPAMPDNNARMLTVVYLASMSGEYLVQR